MRKKNPYLLYPMVGVAAAVVIVILLNSWICPEEKIFSDEEVVYQAVVASPVVEQGKTYVCDLLITTPPYQGITISARILSPASQNPQPTTSQPTTNNPQPKTFNPNKLAILDGLEVKSRIDTDTSRYARVNIPGKTFITPSSMQRKQVSLSHLSIIQRARLRMLKLREGLIENLRRNIDDEAFSIIAAMALGDKSSLSRQTKALFSQTGTSHILALSGLHIGIIYAFILLLLGGKGVGSPRRRVLTSFLSLLPVWAFVMLVGMPFSAIRSATMITIYALILALGRRSPSLNTLALAAVVILVANPKSLFDVGFQLSFLSMVGIFTILPFVMSQIPMRWQAENRLTAAFLRASLISISAQIATAPLVAYYFHTFSVYFLLNNYVVVPLATIILYLAIAYFIAIPISAAVQSILALVLSSLVGFLEHFLSAMSAFPFAVVSNLYPDRMQVVIIYLLIVEAFLFVYHNTPKRLALILTTAILLILYSALC